MTKVLKIGNRVIGGGNPVLIQSMVNTKTADIDATVASILQLEKAGCEIIRATVPDKESADAIKEIKKRINIPLVADIHFDHRLAIQAVKNGVDKVRINPGNIGSEEGVKALVDVLKDYSVPVRIGVNGGSLDKEIEEKYGNGAEALVESALKHVAILEKFGFYEICISVKASSVVKTVQAYELLSKKVDYPLHLGVTETGNYTTGLVKSSVGIGSLLLKGIGDTLRVSLVGDPIREVYAAKDILAASGRREFGVEIVACPTCGRTEIQVEKLAEKVAEYTSACAKKIKIAVMGCVVNGIGEGKDADIGVAGGKDKSVLFSKGQILKTVSNEDLEKELFELIDKYVK